MMIEIRAAEGVEVAKLLIEDMLRIYQKWATRRKV